MGRQRTQKLMAERERSYIFYIGNKAQSDSWRGIHQVCDPIAPTFILPEESMSLNGEGEILLF